MHFCGIGRSKLWHSHDVQRLHVHHCHIQTRNVHNHQCTQQIAYGSDVNVTVIQEHVLHFSRERQSDP